MTSKQMPLIAEPWKKQEPSPITSDQLILSACNGFEFLPTASEQMTSPVCDGSKPLPVASEQTPLPAVPETEQELLSVEWEDVVAYSAGDVTGVIA